MISGMQRQRPLRHLQRLAEIAATRVIYRDLGKLRDRAHTRNLNQGQVWA